MSRVALEVWPLSRPLEGSVPVVADAEILERTLLFASLCNGASRLTVAHAPRGLDTCLEALRALGVSVQKDDEDLILRGAGLVGFDAPQAALDTTGAPVFGLGLLGCLCAQRFESTLVQADPGEVESALEFLGSRGAHVTATPTRIAISVALARLRGGAFALTPAQAGLKHLLLVSGLYASEATTVREAVISADHTERALEALGSEVSTLGPVVRLEPASDAQMISGFEARIPGSPSAAAYLQAVAATTPESHVVVRDVSLNPTRSSFVELLRHSGAEVGLSPRWDSLGEPGGEVSVRAKKVAALSVGGELAVRLDHEFYALVYLAARATGTSEFSGLPPWLTSPDVARIVAYLKSFGVQAQATSGGFFVEGKGERPLRATRVTTGGDPRLAVLGIMLALAADDGSVIDDVETLSVLFPKLIGTFRALGARLEVIHE